MYHSSLTYKGKACSGGYRFGYQGQFAEDETQETGFNAFEARLYDAKIGRWTTRDPKEQYYSPYLAMGNKPTEKYDPDGKHDYSINDGTISLIEETELKYHRFYDSKEKNFHYFSIGDLGEKPITQGGVRKVTFEYGKDIHLFNINKANVAAIAMTYKKNNWMISKMASAANKFDFQNEYEDGMNSARMNAIIGKQYQATSAMSSGGSLLGGYFSFIKSLVKDGLKVFDMYSNSLDELPDVPDAVINKGVEDLDFE